LHCFIQGFHEEIVGRQQPILSLIYKAEQLTENYQEELTPEQVTELSQQSALLKAAFDKVSGQLSSLVSHTLSRGVNNFSNT
jgi:hypothetical protein